MKYKSQCGYTIVELLFFMFWVAFIAGWVINIAQVVRMMLALTAIANASGYLVLKVVSIFIFPVGAILGWIGVFI